MSYNEQGEFEGVKYDRLSAVLANAVQELAAQGSLDVAALSRLERQEQSGARSPHSKWCRWRHLWSALA